MEDLDQNLNRLVSDDTVHKVLYDSLIGTISQTSDSFGKSDRYGKRLYIIFLNPFR